MKRFIVGAITFTTVGCGSVPPTHIYSGANGAYRDVYYTPQGLNPDTDAGKPGAVGQEGRDFCRHVENSAREVAVKRDAGGWTFGILSVLAIGVGSALSASSPDKPSTFRKFSAGFLPVLGAGFGYMSYGQFSRSKDASTLAATATGGVKLDDDKKANDACNEAIENWNGTRPGANKTLSDATGKGGGESVATDRLDNRQSMGLGPIHVRREAKTD